MALWRGQGDELGIAPPCDQALGNLFLLFERKQDVGFRADHQRAADVQGGQSAQYIAASVFTQAEPVHRAAEIEVAVGVELAHESSGMEIGRASCRERVCQYV